jgi:hypothetical protein
MPDTDSHCTENGHPGHALRDAETGGSSCCASTRFGTPTAFDAAMAVTGRLTRRLFFCAAAPMSVAPLPAANKQQEYRFRTSHFDITLTVEYHDKYSSRGFHFREDFSKRDFCLSAAGEESRQCLTGFRGSLAIARYSLRSRLEKSDASTIREYVRTVDRDPRLPQRPPFERTIQLQQGTGSDLQAFGYQPEKDDKSDAEFHGPWYLFRQDLFLEPNAKPFLAIYWKHALDSIRALDVIPGEQTWPFMR